MLRGFTLLLFTGVLAAQSPGNAIDPLGRTSPQESIVHFLEACHARDYLKAMMFLDLRKIPSAERAQQGPELARQLEDLLDDTSFEITSLSRDPEGDQNDGLAPASERLAAFNLQGQTIDLQMERVEPKPGTKVWVVSSASIPLIPQAHQLVGETPFEKKLPQSLVTYEILDTPVWRWLALILVAAALWIVFGLLTAMLATAMMRIAMAARFRGPLRACLTAAGLRAAMGFAPPATLARTALERGLELIFVLGVAGLCTAAVDVAGERWRSRLDPRMQAVSFSVLPLVLQVAKLSLYLIAILTVLSTWGYNTSTILAGLGVGGLAVALAAQKTIENLFGGISVIGDRPVLVGDVCRFGDRTGTVMHIGLRSTRLRTPDRTIVTVPNGQFSSMALENLSGRDKIWFHTTFSLRRDATAEQLQNVLSSLRQILAARPKIEAGKMPVRFVGVGPYSLDVEVDAMVNTADNDEFIQIRQDVLIEMLKSIEAAGTGLAVPWHESFDKIRPNEGS